MLKKIHLIRNILLSNVARLSAPYKVTFALTYKCNLRCKICQIWRKCPQAELSVAQIAKLFRSLKNLSWLDLTGGEMTVRDDAADAVEAILGSAKKLAVMHISVNGQLPQRSIEIIKRVRKYNVVSIVNISIDGPREINDDLRGCSGAYDRSIETFSLIKELGINHTYVSCTLSNRNLMHIDRLISGLQRDIREFNIQDLHFNISHSSAHYYENQSDPYAKPLDPELIDQHFARMQKGTGIKKILSARYRKALFEYLKNGRSPVRCQALRSTVFINPYGEVYPCAMHNIHLGGMRDCGFDINSMWDSAAFGKTREAIAEKKCPGCWSPCEAYPALLADLKGFFR